MSLTPTTVSYTGAEVEVVVPAGVGLADVYMWAGGGGSNGAGSGAGDAARGGPGGFVKFRIAVTALESLYAKVGQGGRKGTGTRVPGTGGGRSQLRRGSTILGVAGAGGGAGGYGSSNAQSYGGKGGGTTAGAGQDGSTNSGGAAPGQGGTQLAGGAAGTPGSPSAGAALQGGDGPDVGAYNPGGWPNGGKASTSGERGGGGGDGWFGGGGGGGNGTWGNGGGGGSSYADASATDVVHEQGVGAVPPGTAEVGYASGIAAPGISGNDGGNGRIYIVWIATSSVSGLAVDNASDGPLERVVDAFDRDGKVLLGTTTSDVITGAYALTLPVVPGTEVQIVGRGAGDEDGDMENDVIIRVLTE